MKVMKSTQVFNGSYGEIWVDDYYVAEATAAESKITFDKQEVSQAGKISKGYKIVGTDGKGSIKMNKCTSYFQTKLLNEVQAGRTPSSTIVIKVDDPDAVGAERVQLDGVVFDELPLTTWEVKKLGEESLPFTFETAKFLDVAEE